MTRNKVKWLADGATQVPQNVTALIERNSIPLFWPLYGNLESSLFNIIFYIRINVYIIISIFTLSGLDYTVSKYGQGCM